METSVLVELVSEVVPLWGSRLEKYLQEAESSQKSSSGITVTPSGVETPKAVEAGRDGSSTRRIILTPGVETTPGVASAVVAPLPHTTLTPGGAEPLDTNKAVQFKNALGVHGACKLDAKPDSKSRFSSLTSPAVLYDGESQQMLCEMWTALNNKRGGLRVEMMALKRRQQLAVVSPPRVTFENAIESEDGTSSDRDEDDEDLEHSAEMLRLRLKMEREKMKRMNRRGPSGMNSPSLGPGTLQFKRARMISGPPGAAPPTPPGSQQGERVELGSGDDEKLRELLDTVDENLDKACKVIETTAFVWLKGDPYDGHLKFILARLKDSVEKIEQSGFVPSKDKAERKTADMTIVAMGPPQTPPETDRVSPRLEISKKKSDLTMRDTPSLGPSQVVHPMEKQAERKISGTSSEDTVVQNMDNVNPLMVRPGGVQLGKANPLEPEMLEAENDDEGIVC